MVEANADCLDAGEPAVSLADGARDRPCGIEVVGCEVDVERNEGAPGTDRRCAGRRMRSGWSEIGNPGAALHLLRESFEPPASNRLERLAFRLRGRITVQKYRNGEALRHGFADAPSQCHAIGHGGIAYRNERNDIDRTDPRVFSLVGSQVDPRDGNLVEAQNSLHERVGVADNREDRAVVGRICRMVEERRAVDELHGVHKGMKNILVPPLADVRNRLEDRHGRNRLYNRSASCSITCTMTRVRKVSLPTLIGT